MRIIGGAKRDGTCGDGGFTRVTRVCTVELSYINYLYFYFLNRVSIAKKNLFFFSFLSLSLFLLFLIFQNNITKNWIGAKKNKTININMVEKKQAY